MRNDPSWVGLVKNARPLLIWVMRSTKPTSSGEESSMNVLMVIPWRVTRRTVLSVSATAWGEMPPKPQGPPPAPPRPPEVRGGRPVGDDQPLGARARVLRHEPLRHEEPILE